MSLIVIDNQAVHYEVFGRGQPVLFLHGWLGSWRYWFPTIEIAARHYRTYSFDFWGFGDSQHKTVHESIRTYSHQVIRFLDELGIERAAVVGHSMGGMVAMKTALDYPDRVARVATVGAPFHGEALSWFLKLNDNPLLVGVFARWSWLRRTLFRFFMGKSQDPAAQEIIDESLKSNAATLSATIRSMMYTDLRPELPGLHVPALVVHGGRDEIVHPNQVKLFAQVAQARVALMPRSRHFPFFDNPDVFHEHLLGFLQETSTPVAPSSAAPAVGTPDVFSSSGPTSPFSRP